MLLMADTFIFFLKMGTVMNWGKNLLSQKSRQEGTPGTATSLTPLAFITSTPSQSTRDVMN
jgi:hypothetical protein